MGTSGGGRGACRAVAIRGCDLRSLLLAEKCLRQVSCSFSRWARHPGKMQRIVGLTCFVFGGIVLLPVQINLQMGLSEQDQQILFHILQKVASSSSSTPAVASPLSPSPPSPTVVASTSSKSQPPTKKDPRNKGDWSRKRRDGIEKLRRALMRVGARGIGSTTNGIRIVDCAANIISNAADRQQRASSVRNQPEIPTSQISRDGPRILG